MKDKGEVSAGLTSVETLILKSKSAATVFVWNCTESLVSEKTQGIISEVDGGISN